MKYGDAEHIQKCWNDKVLQKNWTMKIGDFVLCNFSKKPYNTGTDYRLRVATSEDIRLNSQNPGMYVWLPEL